MSSPVPSVFRVHLHCSPESILCSPSCPAGELRAHSPGAHQSQLLQNRQHHVSCLGAVGSWILPPMTCQALL